MKTTGVERRYDVVIIGSGLAGLVCGSILSKEGKKVCIVEKNEQLGGSLQTFRRDGVTFDTGVHYIGGLDKGQNLYQFFNYLGIMDRLELQRMDPEGFDMVLFKDDPVEYPYGMGYDNFIRVLSQKFPEEHDVIVAYCNELRRICDSFPLYNLRVGELYSDPGIFKRSVKQYLEELTPNQKLRSVLGGTNLLYAGIGDKTPLYVHALVLNSYIESSWKCTQGSDQISNLIAKSIKAMGGDIFRKKKVTKIHVEDGDAEFVLLDDGSRIYAETFISNVNPTRTLEMTDTEKIRKAYRSRIQSLENSISVFVIYATMKPGTWKYQNRNYYYFDEFDVWKCADYTEQTWPYTYAMFECVPHHQNEYAEAITIMSYMRFEEVKQWADTFNTTVDENDRGDAYSAFKHRKAEKLLDTVEVKFPGIRNQIQSYYTSSPLSYRDYIGNDDGNMYGIIKDFNDPLKSFISPKTKVSNLLLTGQNVNLHGVLGVTVSAVLTCGMLLGKDYLLNKIVAANSDSNL
jgi:all-trans-retinol 13,14-reductase